MRSQYHHRHAIKRGIIVPAGEIEIYLANGWHLADEPNYSGARMLPLAALSNFHRIDLSGVNTNVGFFVRF